MCGIAGIVGPAARDPSAPDTLARMLELLRHRGPDDAGVFASAGALLGARRLAVVDPEGGHQPQVAEAEGVAVCLNGELYRHAVLRRELEAKGHRFRTRSDTEVLLRLWLEEGVRALERIEGMYALAVWDARSRSLHLARDRMGEKPLVYAAVGEGLVFASEWRALRAHASTPTVPDAEAIALYLLHRFVPAPRTPVAGVFRLRPGEHLRWCGGRREVRSYWTLPAPAGVPRAARVSATAPRTAVRDLRALLVDAVRTRLVADVPLGVFLSGGVDSGAITAIARRFGPVETFTLRPDDGDFDEGEAALRTARFIGANHHEVRVDAARLERAFASIFDEIDEPIGDSSLVPTRLLAEGAREHVKVVLSGEGADELFGGYPTYPGARLAPLVAHPWPRGVLALLSRRAAAGRFRNVGTAWLLGRLADGAPLPPIERHLLWTGAFSPGEQQALWRPEARPAILDGRGDGLFDVARAAAAGAAGTGDAVDALLRMDLLLHLPDALLAKVDRATMRVGLEARTPFLERRLVEEAASMPARWKVRGLSTKVVLKEVLRGLLPPEALCRRKRGFAVPVSRALAGPLGDRLLERIGPDGPASSWLDPALPRALLDAHRRGVADHGRRLYALLALLEWLDRWLPPASGAPGPVRAGRSDAASAPSASARARSRVATRPGHAPAA